MQPCRASALRALAAGWGVGGVAMTPAAARWLSIVGSIPAEEQPPAGTLASATPAGSATSVLGSGAAAFADSFRSPPSSLAASRTQVVYPPQLEANLFGRALLTLIGAYGEKQRLRNGAAVMYQAITEAAEDPQLQQALGLQARHFMTTHSLLSLHMWLVINRLHEAEAGKAGQVFQQALYTDYFYKDVERRVYAHGVKLHVSKWLKKLEQQFYGSCMAYDVALRAEGGATQQQAEFVAALVKNVYAGDESRRPWALLMARYLSRELECLRLTDTAELLAGQVRFSGDVATSSSSSSSKASSSRRDK